MDSYNTVCYVLWCGEQRAVETKSKYFDPAYRTKEGFQKETIQNPAVSVSTFISGSTMWSHMSDVGVPE